MDKSISKALKDLQNYSLPKDDKNVEKIKTTMELGKRVFWYYKDDLEFYEGEGESVKDYNDALFSGLVITIPGIERGQELDVNQAIIIVDSYPTEKESPETYWMSLGRLLEDENIVEIYSIDYE
jgi:hypothetical protein